MFLCSNSAANSCPSSPRSYSSVYQKQTEEDHLVVSKAVIAAAQQHIEDKTTDVANTGM